MSLRNRFVLPFVLSILAVLAGCGSSTPAPTPPPSGGFSNSNLSGTYVISTSGSDVNGFYMATAGTITANGSGGITGGTLDINDSDTTLNGAFQSFGQAITNGNYSIGVDGRGTISIVAPLSKFTFDIVLSSSQHGLITEFDGSGSGSGTLDLQTSTVTQTQLAQGYAFSVSGSDTNSNVLAGAGAFVAGSDGTISSGVHDFNDSLINYTNLGLGGSVVLGSTGGSGTAQFATALGTLNFDFFVIDPTHLKLIETDALGTGLPVLAGDAFQQTSIPTGTLVFTMAGESGGAPLAAGGFMTSSGAAQTTNGLEDVNVGGTLSSTQVPFTLNYSAPVDGRSELGLGSFAGGPSLIAAYPSSGGLLMLEIDNGGVASGVAFAQTSTALAVPPQGYGLNLSGFNPNGEIDDIAEFVTASGGTMTGLLDENDQGIPEPVQSITNNSVFQQDSPVTGRGEAQFNSSSTNTLFDVVFYTVDGTNSIFIENDTSQVAVGSFQQQSGTTQSSMERSHPLTVVRMPMSRASMRHLKMAGKKK